MVASAHYGLSPEARQQLERELAALRAQREAMSPRPGEQDRTGDAADQAGFLERAEGAAWLDRRIAEMQALLEHGGVNDSLLPEGTLVKLRFSDGDEETLRVFAVPRDDADGSTLTSDSPLGRALVGHKAGDEITYRTPRGQTKATILSIEPPKAD
jgi:transcription elongation GreA/GreB family factor